MKTTICCGFWAENSRKIAKNRLCFWRLKRAVLLISSACWMILEGVSADASDRNG